MPIEFSFVALFNLVLIFVTGYFLYRAFRDYVSYLVDNVKNEPVEEKHPLDLINFKWLIAMIISAILLAFNPIDMSISDQAERQKQKDMSITREFKQNNIPPRVEVEDKSLDEVIKEFDNRIEETSKQNKINQNLNK